MSQYTTLQKLSFKSLLVPLQPAGVLTSACGDSTAISWGSRASAHNGRCFLSQVRVGRIGCSYRWKIKWIVSTWYYRIVYLIKYFLERWRRIEITILLSFLVLLTPIAFAEYGNLQDKCQIILAKEEKIEFLILNPNGYYCLPIVSLNVFMTFFLLLILVAKCRPH